jgi:hypothetical protein
VDIWGPSKYHLLALFIAFVTKWHSITYLHTPSLYWQSPPLKCKLHQGEVFAKVVSCRAQSGHYSICWMILRHIKVICHLQKVGLWNLLIAKSYISIMNFLQSACVTLVIRYKEQIIKMLKLKGSEKSNYMTWNYVHIQTTNTFTNWSV